MVGHTSRRWSSAVPWMLLATLSLFGCDQASRAAAGQDADGDADGDADAAPEVDATGSSVHCEDLCGRLLAIECATMQTPATCRGSCLAAIAGPCADRARVLQNCLTSASDEAAKTGEAGPWFCIPGVGVTITSAACPEEQMQFRVCATAGRSR